MEDTRLISRRLKRVAVFCGASPGHDPQYLEAAVQLGEELVRRGIGIVYGGGNKGMMGAIAQTVYRGLGEGSVIGVIPETLKAIEVSGPTIGRVIDVENMHVRKATMSDLADAFIGLPGGFGTLEEMLEVITWSVLGLHTKPVGFLNVKGYFNALLEFFDKATAEGFVRPQHRAAVLQDNRPANLLDAMESNEQTGKIEKGAGVALVNTKREEQEDPQRSSCNPPDHALSGVKPADHAYHE